MSSSESQFFPAIGKVAEQADTVVPESGRDENLHPIEQVESLCMQCHQQGNTRMLLTSIPYFGQVLVMSFRCEQCGFSNNEIQSAGTIRPQGVIYVVKILHRSDLNRQIVRSEFCEVQIPELDLTLPVSPSQRGQLTTVEGLLRNIHADLSMHQPARKHIDEANYNAIQALLDKISSDVLGAPTDDGHDENDHGNSDATVKPVTTVTADPLEVEKLMMPFTLKLDDPSGNSFVEFVTSMADPKWTMRAYPRTQEHNVQLGLVPAATAEDPKSGESETMLEQNDEVYAFPGTCSSCGVPSTTKMKKVNIPYFKDVIIMSTNCEKCGYRDNEIKSGAAISEKGKRIILRVEDQEDLARDILKSETAGLKIPEINLELTHGTLGGRFTTIEGILTQVYEELAEKTFYQGDSKRSEEDKPAFEVFLQNLKEITAAERPFTVILDDPLANSYIQSLYAPDPDPNLTFEIYDRTHEQNEELGINDMKVEGYDDGGDSPTRSNVDIAENTEKNPTG